MNRQKGVSLSGLLIGAVILIVVALFGFKLIPPYLQFLSVKKNINAIANDPELKSASVLEIKRAFDRRAQFDGITIVDASALEISKAGGQLAISAAFSTKVPLAGNVSACIDFQASNNK